MGKGGRKEKGETGRQEKTRVKKKQEKRNTYYQLPIMPGPLFPSLSQWLSLSELHFLTCKMKLLYSSCGDYELIHVKHLENPGTQQAQFKASS